MRPASGTCTNWSRKKADVGTQVAGNNSTGAKLALGGTISVKGSDVALSSTENLENKLASDYSSANVTTQVSGSDGNATTTVYLKKDLVGRSLTLGTIGSDGNVANSERTASLYQAQSQASGDTAMVGHLFLAGEKRTAYAENPTVTHTSADLFVKDGAEGDDAKGDLLKPDLSITRIYYTDEGNYTYALATMDDGFHAAGDSGKADILLNKTPEPEGWPDNRYWPNSGCAAHQREHRSSSQQYGYPEPAPCQEAPGPDLCHLYRGHYVSRWMAPA